MLIRAANSVIKVISSATLFPLVLQLKQYYHSRFLISIKLHAMKMKMYFGGNWDKNEFEIHLERKTWPECIT